MQIDSFWIRWILIHFVLSMAVVIKWISSSFACESFQNLIGPNFLKLLNIGEQKIYLFCSLNGSCDKVNKFVFCMWILPELYGVECSFSVWFGKKLGLFQTIRGNDEIEGTIHVSCVKKAKVTFLIKFFFQILFKNLSNYFQLIFMIWQETGFVPNH